jgi:hypothetical protein
MTDDLVKRLRDRDAYAKKHGWDNVVFGEAADRIEKLEARITELTRHLIIVTDDCWPYLHQHCTIDAVKKGWKDARKALEGKDGA